MQVKDHQHTIRTTDVVNVFDEAKKLNWYISFEKTNGMITASREIFNEHFFISQGGKYMQKVYELAYNHINRDK